MTIRIIPDLLTHGDRALGLPRPPKGFAHIIGKGFPEARPKPLNEQDAGGAREATLREWLAHVEAGRIGLTRGS